MWSVSPKFTARWGTHTEAGLGHPQASHMATSGARYGGEPQQLIGKPFAVQGGSIGERRRFPLADSHLSLMYVYLMR
jgi:hypothetical protein